MKQRVISSVIGLLILALVLALFDTIALNIAVAVIIAMSLNELFSAAGCHGLPMARLAIIFGAVIPFLNVSFIGKMFPAICFAFAFILLCMMIKHYKVISSEKVGFILFFSIAIAFSLSCFIYLRDTMGMTVGIYAVLVAMGGAWLNDTGAYFVGIRFGKHKLAPEISPKKTIEGFWGGIVVSMLSQLLFALSYTYVCAFYGVIIEINYVILAIVAPFIAFVSVIGDLSASAMKRQFGIKDFGNIMPGHGGAMDRFDSVFLTAVLVYNIFEFMPLITVK